MYFSWFNVRNYKQTNQANQTANKMSSTLNNTYFIEGKYRNVFWSETKTRHYYKNEMGKKILLKNHITSYKSCQRSPKIIVLEDDVDDDDDVEVSNNQTEQSNRSIHPQMELTMQEDELEGSTLGLLLQVEQKEKFSELREILILQVQEKWAPCYEEKKAEIAAKQLELFAMQEEAMNEELRISEMSDEEILQKCRGGEQSVVITTPVQVKEERQRGNCDRSVKRTPVNMGIQVGDVLEMNLKKKTWTVKCVSEQGVGVFEVLSSPGREDIVGVRYNKGSPINKIFQDLVVSLELRKQSFSPWNCTRHLRDGVVVTRRLEILPEFRK